MTYDIDDRIKSIYKNYLYECVDAFVDGEQNLFDFNELYNRIESLYNSTIQGPINVIKGVQDKLNNLRYEITSMEKTSIIFYIINSNNMCKDCRNIDDVYDVLDNWLDKGNSISINDIIKSNKNFKTAYYETIENIIYKYYNDDYIKYNINDLLALLNTINSNNIFKEEIQLITKTNDSGLLILALINILEELIYKIDNKYWGRLNINNKDIIEAELAADALIDTLVLNSNYEKIHKDLLIPNRHIIVHESLLHYKDYDKTLLILINMIYNIINFRIIRKLKQI